MQWSNDPGDAQQGAGQSSNASAGATGQQFLPGADFPFGLDFGADDGHFALLESLGGDPGSSDGRTKRQRLDAGEASVEAYMAHLAAPPPLQRAQSSEAEPPGSATAGGIGSGSGAGPTLRARSMAFDDDLEDESAGATGGQGGRSRGGAVANPSKAHRERARRERLNDGFAELALLLDAGKAVRTDKLSIIADAVKEVTKLRAESHQLRQLNKFLEERVKDLETAKHQAELARMMSAQLGQQQQQQQQAGGGGGGGGAGAAAAGPSSGSMPAGFVQHGFGQAFVPGLGVPGGMIAVPAAALQQLTAMGGHLLPGGQAAGLASNPMAQSVSHINAGMALMQQAQAHHHAQQQQTYVQPAADAKPEASAAQAHPQQPQQQAQPSPQQQHPQQQQAPVSLQQQFQQVHAQQQQQQGTDTPPPLPPQQQQQQQQLQPQLPFPLPGIYDGGQAASMPPNPLWLAPGALDTSQDHLRRPPAA